MDTNKIKWRKTSVGGYIASGGALLRSWSAYITPADDSCEWYASAEVDGRYVTSTHTSAAAAKRWCAKEIAKK